MARYRAERYSESEGKEITDGRRTTALGTVAPWSGKKGPRLPYCGSTSTQPGSEFHRRRRGGDSGTLARVAEKAVLTKVRKIKSKRTSGGGVERRVQRNHRRRRARPEAAMAWRRTQRRPRRQCVSLGRARERRRGGVCR